MKILWGKVLLFLRVFYYISGIFFMLIPFIVIIILYKMNADMEFKNYILNGIYPFSSFKDPLKVMFYGGCFFPIGILELLISKFVFSVYKKLTCPIKSSLNEHARIIKYDSFGEEDQDLTKLYEICKIESHVK